MSFAIEGEQVDSSLKLTWNTDGGARERLRLADRAVDARRLTLLRVDRARSAAKARQSDERVAQVA